MRGRERWSTVMHAIPTVGLMLQGVLYVTTPTFMPAGSILFDKSLNIDNVQADL